MGFLGNVFRRKSQEESAPVATQAPPASPTAGPKQVQGVLVLTRRPLDNSQGLLQQIVDQQRAEGRSIAPNFVGTAREGDWNDQAYVYAAVRSTFAAFGDADVIDRTRIFDFQAPDGNDGKYLILYDRT